MSQEATLTAAHHDPLGAKTGMWLFLLTELLLFGGLFLLYAVYRAANPEDFHFAAGTLDTLLGTVNTLVLLTSSLTMALSIHALGRRRTRASLGFVLLTMGLGLGFLVIKGFEWSAKFHHGLYPNAPELLRHTPGENLFYGLYFAMTGLHGVHVVVGIGVLAVMAWGVSCAPAPAGGEHRWLGRLENGGLFWHLVDVVWIFLFPLFYLIS